MVRPSASGEPGTQPEAAAPRSSRQSDAGTAGTHCLLRSASGQGPAISSPTRDRCIRPRIGGDGPSGLPSPRLSGRALSQRRRGRRLRERRADPLTRPVLVEVPVRLPYERAAVLMAEVLRARDPRIGRPSCRADRRHRQPRSRGQAGRHGPGTDARGCRAFRAERRARAGCGSRAGGPLKTGHNHAVFSQATGGVKRRCWRRRAEFRFCLEGAARRPVVRLLDALPRVVRLSSERVRQAARQDCSFAKKQASPGALLGVVRRSCRSAGPPAIARGGGSRRPCFPAQGGTSTDHACPTTGCASNNAQARRRAGRGRSALR